MAMVKTNRKLHQYVSFILASGHVSHPCGIVSMHDPSLDQGRIESRRDERACNYEIVMNLL